MTQITEHFSLEEMTASEHARELGITNKVPASLMPNLRRICLVLEEVRKAVGGPLSVTSGYRNPQVNAAAKGSLISAHMDARAADINAKGLTARALAKAILKAGVHFDKMILEYDSWVHIQVRKDAGAARKEVLLKDATHDYTPLKL